jgi:hypothetical protein
MVGGRVAGSSFPAAASLASGGVLREAIQLFWRGRSGVLDDDARRIPA